MCDHEKTYIHAIGNIIMTPDGPEDNYEYRDICLDCGEDITPTGEIEPISDFLTRLENTL